MIVHPPGYEIGLALISLVSERINKKNKNLVNFCAFVIVNQIVFFQNSAIIIILIIINIHTNYTGSS